MSYIGICLRGLEEVAEKETKGKKIYSGRVSFLGKSLSKKLSKNNFKSLLTVYRLYKKFNFKDKEEILDEFKKLKIKVKKSFRVKCNREGNHEFKSVDIEKLIGIYLQKNGFKLDFKEPKTVIFIDIVEDFCLIGLLEKEDMQKREYRVKLNPETLNSTIAYSALILSEYKKNDVLVDPNCRDGIIVVEGSLMKKGKVYGFDMNTRNARINSKIAKVKVELGQNEIDWLDTKFKKNSVKIVSYLPSASKRNNESDVRRFYSEFFHQAKYIVKDKMCLIVKKTELIKEYFNDFKLIKEINTKIGDDDYSILVLKKSI
ncbi:MAG: THUMP domain-containing protein [Nanoarchaeota archaeon]